MLLREFVVGNHTINLFQESELYIATVRDSLGEKIFNHEYNDYDVIKSCFDGIIHYIDQGGDDIQEILKLLKSNSV